MYSRYSLKLLADRLTLHYGEDNAKELMLTHKDNLFGYHGLAWSLGKRDLTFFCLYFLQDTFIGDGLAELAPIHYEVWDTMNDMYVHNSHTQHAFILPRGTGKSLTGSLPISIWSNLYNFSQYTVVASAVNDTALTFINNIRNALIDNEYIKSAFGAVYDPSLINTTDRIELANKTMIQALSSRSTFRGKSYLGNRITLLILDDFQSEENVSSKSQMQKHWKRFSDDSGNAIQKNNYKMVAMGTIITKGDFYDRLTVLPTWKHTKRRAIDIDDLDKFFSEGLWGEFKEILFNQDDDDRLDNAKEFYYEHEEDMQYPLLWQDYWSCLEMALKYYENPESFKQEMQLEFGNSSSKKFSNVTYRDDITDGNVLVIDPATSSKANSDYTAFVVGKYENDRVYVEYGHIDRLEFEDYISTTIGILKNYPSIDTIIVEKQTYNGADVTAMKNLIQRDQDLYYRSFHWENNHQSKNKDNKINSIVGDVAMGRVQFNSELKGSEAMEQLTSFVDVVSSPHDDFPDALSELVLFLKEDNLEEDLLQVFDRNLLF